MLFDKVRFFRGLRPIPGTTGSRKGFKTSLLHMSTQSRIYFFLLNYNEIL